MSALRIEPTTVYDLIRTCFVYGAVYSMTKTIHFTYLGILFIYGLCDRVKPECRPSVPVIFVGVEEIPEMKTDSRDSKVS